MCYPSATSAPSTITVAPNEERTGVDMQLALTRLARIEGVVKGMPLDQRGVDPIILFSGDDLREGIGQDSVRPDLEGRFSFTNVSPGPYKLVLRGAANGAAGGPPVKAAADVVVADEDLHNVLLDLQPGVSVSGKVVFRGTTPPPSASVLTIQGFEIRLDPINPSPLTARYPGSFRAGPDAAGQFVIRDVVPGEHHRIAMGQRDSTGWFLDAATIAGLPAANQRVQVKRQDLVGLTVTMTDRRAELSGCCCPSRVLTFPCRL